MCTEPSMPNSLRIDDAVWELGTPLQRAEWVTLICDLLDEGVVSIQGATRARALTIDSCRIYVETEPACCVLVWNDAMTNYAAEYIQIIRRLMDRNLHVAQVEAIDMAKKVVHDRAARGLAELAPGLADSHETYRRLFSLLVSLRENTTLLPAAHGHHFRA
jgi:hypothetical protein